MFWCLVFEVTDLSVSGQAKLREVKDQLMQRRHQPVRIIAGLRGIFVKPEDVDRATRAGSTETGLVAGE
jgi:hypothetical protein